MKFGHDVVVVPVVGASGEVANLRKKPQDERRKAICSRCSFP